MTTSSSTALVVGSSSSMSLAQWITPGRKTGRPVVVGRRPSRLFQLLEEKKWNEVSDLLEKKPNEAKVWGEGALNVSSLKSTSSSKKLFHSTRRDANNQPLKQKKKTTVLPLHVALQLGAPLEVIEKLLEIFPKALQKKDSKFKRYPLHFACLYHPSLEVIELIMKGFQQALWSPDCLSRLPIHYASFNSSKSGESPQILQLLLQNFPLGAQITDKYGWIPLHIAVRHSASFEATKRLVAIYPSGLFVRTQKGSTAKDLARAFQNVSSSTIMTDLDVLESTALALLETSEIHSTFLSVADAIWSQRNQSSSSSSSSPQEDRATTVVLNRIVEEEEEDVSSSSCPTIKKKNDEPQQMPSLIQDNACVVCLEADSTHVFVPCGHLCVCQECMEDMQACAIKKKKQGNCCPVCRKTSFMTMRVYAS